MKPHTSERGFSAITHPTYSKTPTETRLIGQSSAIGEYPDSLTCPGSSYLWIGRDHHLDREEVHTLVGYLSSWLATGELLPPEEI